ncbi:hypothetical protein C8F04DRAFT_1195971 [Mycena alexandri]|uniref:Uncharacterized protein n=1 Tax=Mycena alexandri TaxID=1745969 RepID=A0AAD6WU28_9AGAR|nr:hypothetical protein C8F04DRAFT_1195971 [Mycena alexandri]
MMPPKPKPPPTKVVCNCTVHGCSNQRGGFWAVTPTVYKQHKDAQHAADLRAMAVAQGAADRARLEAAQTHQEEERKKEAASKRAERQDERKRLRNSGIQEQADAALKDLQRMDREQAELLSQIQWAPDSLPARQKVARFTIDHQHIKLEMLGTLMDLVEQYDLELQKMQPPDGLALNLLHIGVRQLRDLSLRSQNLKRETFPGADVLRQEASCAIKAQTKAIEQAQRAWESAIQKEIERRASEATTYSTAHLYEPIPANALAPVQVILFMVVACSTVLSFSRRGCSWLFRMSHAAIFEIFKMSPGPSTPQMSFTENTFPRDLRTAVKNFRIDSKATTYAVCASCHYIYTPNDAEDLADESQEEAEIQMTREERGDDNGEAGCAGTEFTEGGEGNPVGYNNFATDTWEPRTNKYYRSLVNASDLDPAVVSGSLPTTGNESSPAMDDDFTDLPDLEEPEDTDEEPEAADYEEDLFAESPTLTRLDEGDVDLEMDEVPEWDLDGGDDYGSDSDYECTTTTNSYLISVNSI